MICTIIYAERYVACAIVYTAVALVDETATSVSAAPPPPPISPHSSVYPSNLPSVVLYLKSPAAGDEGLCPVVPFVIPTQPVPPISAPSALVVTRAPLL